eukprot:TRINITY_DN13450_c0_g1_i2.p1 TRINITY_DN13450_c0_g1~~TRINITY_DN13450_c0_g1_i2.p1  ORF type:complete len:379 (+),score=56.45 TRINITY_DN13450_c0_g1_i2:888-2024(+)
MIFFFFSTSGGEGVQFPSNNNNNNNNNNNFSQLELPSSSQLAAIAAAEEIEGSGSEFDALSGTVAKRGVLMGTAVGFINLFTSILGTAWKMLSSGDTTPVTLRQCLQSHCMDEEVYGSNKYECTNCDSLQDATKRIQFAELPEFLIINLKRFSNTGYWSSKTSRTVELPEPDEFLDLGEFCINEIPLPPVTTYQLHGMVCHRGSFHGGHYVSYIRKMGRWILCNDDYLAVASAEHVHGEEAYVLVYQRTRREPESPSAAWSKQRAVLYASKLHEMGSEKLLRTLLSKKPESEIRFISRSWLIAHAWSEAGVICNQPMYPFRKEEEAPQRSVREYYCPITVTDWKMFQESHGGGPEVNHDNYFRLVHEEDTFAMRQPMR